jgi:zinc/manganese transport system permease protein
MHGFWDIMAAPFAECLILVGIHSYLGIHVLKRRVIFVDLSLAQIAALGTTVGIVLGIHNTESSASFIISMAFTFIGAAVFALSRLKNDRVPQEAVIGLVYAITAAVAVIVIGKTRGVEHMMNIMHGRLLWVQWHEVITAAIAYSFIGTLHWIFRKQFMKISERPEEAYAEGMNVRMWDFFFYLTFGFVITFSVKVAGVLLVFVFLVAPAILAFIITEDVRKQLLIGWLSGTVVTVLGLWGSWTMDLPSGPTVVSFYGVVLVLVAIVYYLIKAERKASALGNVALGVVIVMVLFGLMIKGGSWMASSSLAGNDDQLTFGDLGAASHAHFHGHGDEKAEHAGHEGHHHDQLHGDVEHGAHPHPHGDRPATLQERFDEAETPLDNLDVIAEALEDDLSLGGRLLHSFLSDDETPPFCKSSAHGMMVEKLGEDFGYVPDGSDNIEALAALETWLAERDAE